MKLNKLLKTLCFFALSVLTTTLVVMKTIFLKAPIYYDISSWLGWIYFGILFLGAQFFPRLRVFYISLSLIFIFFDGLWTVIFEKNLEFLGVSIINFGYILWIVSILLYFIKYVQERQNH